MTGPHNRHTCRTCADNLKGKDGLPMMRATYHEPPEQYRRRRALGTLDRAADRVHRRERTAGYAAPITEQAMALLRRLYDLARQA